LEFYSTEEVADAKDILLRELDDLKFANIPKIARRRRDSTGNKPALDIEDLFTLLAFWDENGYSSQLPLFVATHPDKMPSVRITAGDLELIWSKLEKLESTLNEVNNRCSLQGDTMSGIADNVRKIKIHSEYKNLTCQMEELKSRVGPVESQSTSILAICNATETNFARSIGIVREQHGDSAFPPLPPPGGMSLGAMGARVDGVKGSRWHLIQSDSI